MTGGPTDPRKPIQMSVFGKKGSGKTELAYRFFDTYPGDRIAIDPNGDLKMPEDSLEIFSPLPTRWPGSRYDEWAEENGFPPAGGRKRRSTLYYIPDPGEPDYLEEIDRAVGLAFAHRHTCMLFTECHEGAPVGKTPPHMRRALRHQRHAGLTSIYDTPRPLTIDPLVVAQSDYVAVFKLPSRQDRQMIADNIGWDVDDFHEGVKGLGKFEYLMYDAANDDLAHYPALPASAIKHHAPSGAAGTADLDDYEE